MVDDRLLSLPEAAQRLGISRRSLRAWVRQMRLGVVRLGRRVLFSPADLEKFIQANRSEPAHIFRNGGGSRADGHR
jgi:excisionase family DNA binding protein